MGVFQLINVEFSSYLILNSIFLIFFYDFTLICQIFFNVKMMFNAKLNNAHA